MRPVYLLDTCMVSEPSKPSPDDQVMERLREYEGRCCISSITWHELIFGIERLPESGKKSRLLTFAMDVVAPFLTVVDYGASAARIHAGLRSEAEAAGRPLPFVDGAIASIALANNLALVTRNAKDFGGIRGLYVENWYLG